MIQRNEIIIYYIEGKDLFPKKKTKVKHQKRDTRVIIKSILGKCATLSVLINNKNKTYV